MKPSSGVIWFLIPVLLLLSPLHCLSGEVEGKNWLLMPTLSTNPKLGTTLGVFAAYLKKLDEGSDTSMLGMVVSKSNTKSTVGAAFLRSYFGAGEHRLNAWLVRGKVVNDYSDFLGLGIHLKSTDKLKTTGFRYLKRLHERWFLGGQFLQLKLTSRGDNAKSQILLEKLGLTGFNATALGLVAQYDSRDNQNSASRGVFASLDNKAFRKSLGGDNNFDTYIGQIRVYQPRGKQVLAGKIAGRWTVNAPRSAFSSMRLPGYTAGQYIDRHVMTLEADWRIHLAERWGLSVYGGLGTLYHHISDMGQLANWYPSVALGVYYTIQKKEKMVMHLSVAMGKLNNHAVYLGFGHPF